MAQIARAAEETKKRGIDQVETGEQSGIASEMNKADVVAGLAGDQDGDGGSGTSVTVTERPRPRPKTDPTEIPASNPKTKYIVQKLGSLRDLPNAQ